jgi:hypothetical protein
MLSATRRGQLSIAELVDAQHIQCRPVRDLFVDYLHERAPGLDYSTLVALVSKIVRLFWRDLEIHELGIDSLHLSDEVARRWKQRLSEVRHGRQRIGQPRQDLAANLMAVRAFYADLTHWALEDPTRWAVWVAPSPVTSRDLAGMGKQRQHAVARTHQRTRELSPSSRSLSFEPTPRTAAHKPCWRLPSRRGRVRCLSPKTSPCAGSSSPRRRTT